MHAQSVLRDPFGADGSVAPAPHLRWEPSQPLPAVGAPVVDGQLTRNLPLSLPELTEFALRNNPRTRQSWLAARAAAAGVGIEKADLLPQLSATYAVTRNQQVTNQGAVVPWQTRYGPSVSLSYVLYDFGVRGYQVETSEYRLLAANLAHNRMLQDVIFLVEQAYYRLIGNDALVRINTQSLRNAETALEAARKRRESGLATVADVYRSETLVAQARLNLTRSSGELEKSRGQLASVVGLPVNVGIAVLPLEAPPQTTEVAGSIGDLLDRAKSSRPDLVAAEAQVRAARANANAVARAGLPSIEVSGGGGRNLFGDNRPGASNYNIGLTVRIPIFSGFRDTYSARQAQVQAEAAAASRDVLVRQAEIEVWQGYYDLTTVTSSISSTEAQVRSAEQTAQATLARYQSGFGSILDLITAQQEESNARVQRIQSYLDWFTTLARLQVAVGASDLLKAAGGAK
ncbi:MAG: TolC family protein [Burkholderiales bacterium]|nr:TolC family protein [Burkholderiales bacterium]